MVMLPMSVSTEKLFFSWPASNKSSRIGHETFHVGSCNLFLCRVILGLRSRETSAAAVVAAAVASTARQGLTVSLTA